MSAEALVTVSELRLRLTEFITSIKERPAVVLRHGRPVAALLSYVAYQGFLDRIEELEDQVAVLQAKEEPIDMSVPLEKVKAEAGLLAD